MHTKGQNILYLRIKKGLTQCELASSAGIKQPNLSRLESGLTNPTIATLEKIALVLGVTVEVLLNAETSSAATPLFCSHCGSKISKGRRNVTDRQSRRSTNSART